jgi:hypothetical protein
VPTQSKQGCGIDFFCHEKLEFAVFEGGVMEMFDEEIRGIVRAEGMVEQKRWVIEDTLQAEEMEQAQAAFLVAEKKFRRLDSDSEVVTNALKNARWWDALEALYQADRALWELFTGRDRSVQSNQMYNAYRERLIRGKRLYRADA